MGAYVTAPNSVARSKGKIKKALLKDVGAQPWRTSMAASSTSPATSTTSSLAGTSYLVTDFLREHGTAQQRRRQDVRQK